MPDVNVDAAGPTHAAYLLHMATRRLREESEKSAARPSRPMQAAQLRLLDSLPTTGGRVSDLATRLQVTKQGLGQIAMQLSHGGFVDIVPDPADRRAKLLVRTPRGDDIVAAMHSAIAAVEDRWRDRIGAERYETFLSVLREIVDDDR